ncbi:MAG TPA: EthD family reductase, partial [Streptosporangiaceae bacterium]
KLVVMYTHPENPEEWDQHYLGVHMPLATKMPGLDRTETGRVATALDGGDQTYYRITTLYFADDAALGSAFGSEEGQATAADYQGMAPAGSRMFIVNEDA